MLVNKRIYLDNASTTRIDERVLEAMFPYFREHYGNASSNHSLGAEAKETLNDCRKRLAVLIGASDDEIVFTGSGTESNNLVIKGIALENRQKGNHIIVSSIEHDCILNACHWLEERGYFVTYLPVNEYGMIDLNRLERCINPKTILVSVMHANNEIGTLAPVSEIGAICRNKGVYFHSDACQSFGKIPINVQDSRIDMLTLNAHKIYGPKGVGALYVRRGTHITPIMHGGGQEKGIRASTENIPGIVGFVKAAELMYEEMNSETQRFQSLRRLLIQNLKDNADGFYLNGHPEKNLPCILNFSFHGLEGETMRLLLLLDEGGIAVSAGSACSSNDKSNGASHVLQSIGRSQFEARGAIRVSMGRYTTEDDIRIFASTILERIKELNPIFS